MSSMRTDLESKIESIVLWSFLWIATLVHAGLTVGVMVATAKFPPGYELSTNWVNLLSQGPTSVTFWFYIIVLGVSTVFESDFKGRLAYVKSSFPFPDIQYSHVAGVLWAVLWLFGHLGASNGWFTFPNKLGATFWTCLLFVFLQRSWNKSNYEEDLQKNSENAEAPQKTEIAKPLERVPISKPVSAAVPAASKPTVSDNADVTEKIIEYVRKNGHAKTGGLIGVLGTPRRTVIRNLNKLIEEGKLVREGHGAGAVYRLNDNPKEERFN